MKKRLMSLLLAICLAAGCLPAATAAAVESPTSGTCGDSLTWRFDQATGTLYIEGTGEMTDYPTGAPWIHLRETITSIQIGSAVTYLGNYAFSGLTSLTYAVVPGNVRRIGPSAFRDCTSLSEVALNRGVEEIGDLAFRNCEQLSKIGIPNTVTKIGEQAFSMCQSLSSIELPESVKELGDFAFSQSAIERITLPTALTSVGESIFYLCPSLESIQLPEGFPYVSSGMFQEARVLRTAVIPDSVTAIGMNAFRECIGLESVTIGRGVTQIGSLAFFGCDSLTDIYYAGSQTEWATIINLSPNTLADVQIHFNSTGPGSVSPDPDEEPQPTGSSYLLAQLTGWDSARQWAYFDGSALAYKVTGASDPGTAELAAGLEGSYVRARVSDNFILLGLEPVEARYGTVTAVSDNPYVADRYIVIDGTRYSDPNPYGNTPMAYLNGKYIRYYVMDGRLLGFDPTEQKVGTLDGWDGINLVITIDGVDYDAQIQDLSFLASIEKWLGQAISYDVLDGVVYRVTPQAYQQVRVGKVERFSNQTFYFTDGNQSVLNNALAADGDQWVGRWVRCILETSAQGRTTVSAIYPLEPALSVELTLLDSRTIQVADKTFSFDGENWQSAAQFEIPFQITITNQIPQGAEDAAAQLRQEGTLAVSVTGVTAQAPQGFNFGWLGGGAPDSGGFTLQAGQSWTQECYLRPGAGYTLTSGTDSRTLACQIQTSAGSRSAEATFRLTAGSKGEEDLTVWEEDLLRTLYQVKDVDVTVNQGRDALLQYFDEDVAEDICRQVNVWKALMESPLTATLDQAPSPCLKLTAPMSRKNGGHQAELIFCYTDYTNTGYQSMNAIRYLLVDLETGRRRYVAGGDVFSVTTSASAKAFADGVRAYLDEQCGDEALDLCKKLAKSAIQESLHDFANLPGNTYINTMLDLISTFDQYKGYIGQAEGILQNPLQAEAATLREFEEAASRAVSVRCPVDVSVYDSTGRCCGRIVDDEITLNTLDTFLYVDPETGEKTLWLSDNSYRLVIEATDSGSMTYQVEEYAAGAVSRTVGFDPIPLQAGQVFEAAIPEGADAPSQDYALETGEGEILYPDRDDTAEIPAVQVLPFADVAPDAWYYEAVGYVYRNGVMNGTGPDAFQPDLRLSRAMIAQILSNLEGAGGYEGGAWFSDVADGAWYANAIGWASVQGLVEGYGDGRFGPEDAITREQLAVVLCRYAGVKGYDMTPSASLDGFVDAAQVSPWAREAMAWTVGTGLITGKDGARLDPAGTATRAEAAAVLMRLLEL